MKPCDGRIAMNEVRRKRSGTEGAPPIAPAAPLLYSGIFLNSRWSKKITMPMLMALSATLKAGQ
jgi:hypothetical protein